MTFLIPEVKPTRGFRLFWFLYTCV